MKDTLIAQIQSFTLQARAALESEAGRQLEGIYGWLPDGRFGDAARYPVINEIPEATETRLRLEAYAEEEQTAGISPKEARIKPVRETAFTWLNLDIHGVKLYRTRNCSNNRCGSFVIADVILNNKRGPFTGLFASSGRVPVYQPNFAAFWKTAHDKTSFWASKVFSDILRSSSAISVYPSAMRS